MVALPVVNGAGGGAAYGVSPDGRTIVGTNKVTNPDGFAVDAPVKWTPKPGGGWIVRQMQAAVGGDISGFARAVTSGGIAAGESTSTKGDVGTRWNRSGIGAGLGALQDSPHRSLAWALSSDGQILVGTSIEGGFRPVIWGPHGRPIRKLADTEGEATDISSDGKYVTGHLYLEDFRQDVFIWDEVNGVRSIKQMMTDGGVEFSDGWSLYKAFISADGRVVGGWGSGPGGTSQGWIWRLEGEESSTYETWAADEGRDGSFDGDGNGDGVVDGVEYATGERNSPRSVGAVITFRGEGGIKRCEFPKRTGLTGVDVVPQFSPDGLNWSPLVAPIYTVDRVGAFDRNEVALPEGRSGVIRLHVMER